MADRLGRLEDYWRRGYLEPGAYRSGAALFADMKAAGAMPMAKLDLEKPNGTRAIPAQMLDRTDAGKRIKAAWSLITEEDQALVTDFLCHDISPSQWAEAKGLPETEGIRRLRRALGILVIVYMPGENKTA
jgi:hypothetical protein